MKINMQKYNIHANRNNKIKSNTCDNKDTTYKNNNHQDIMLILLVNETASSLGTCEATDGPFDCRNKQGCWATQTKRWTKFC